MRKALFRSLLTWRPVNNFSAWTAACCLALTRRAVIPARVAAAREESRILETASSLRLAEDLYVAGSPHKRGRKKAHTR
jgi:hypothetical protein